jgi:uncharacterized membrane protein
MHAVVIALRLLHIVFGVYWVGAILFFVTFLQPSLRDAGPDGMKVVQQIVRRGYLNILPVIAGLTMLAGLVLYWQDAKAMDGVWMSSGIGRALSVGSVAAIVAFLVGFFVMRGSIVRAMALGRSLAQLAEGPERQARMAEIDRLRRRAAISSHWVAGLLLIAVAAMAVARYL